MDKLCNSCYTVNKSMPMISESKYQQNEYHKYDSERPKWDAVTSLFYVKEGENI